MDITFKTPEGRFNYRVCAVIIKENKLLVMQDDRSPYYYLPGGRVRLHETAEDAVLRELREELHIDAKISRPLWLNQSFFNEDVTKEDFHELCLYFLIDISEMGLHTKGESFTSCENGRTNNFRFIPLEDLEKEYLYPIFIKKEIFRLPDTFTLRTEME